MWRGCSCNGALCLEFNDLGFGSYTKLCYWIKSSLYKQHEDLCIFYICQRSIYTLIIPTNNSVVVSLPIAVCQQYLVVPKLLPAGRT